MSHDVPFVRTPRRIVRKMLQVSGLGSGEILYDLGSGDGRVLIVAAREFGARAVGIEARRKLVKRSRKRIKKRGLGQLAKVIEADFFHEAFGEADVVTCYLLPDTLERLRPIFEEQLPEGTRIVSHDYKIHGWRIIKEERIKNHQIFLYYR